MCHSEQEIVSKKYRNTTLSNKRNKNKNKEIQMTGQHEGP